MAISSLAVAGQNARMDSPRPRAGGPQRRRRFSPAEKLAHLAAYEQACSTNDGGAYLRREGLYSSLICEWRKQRDAGDTAPKIIDLPETASINPPPPTEQEKPATAA